MAKLCRNRLWLVPCITGLFGAMLFHVFGIVCSVVLGRMNAELYRVSIFGPVILRCAGFRVSMARIDLFCQNGC